MGIRRPFVGGNWKMNTDLASAVELADDIVAGCDKFVDRCDVAVFPPFPYLQAVGRTLGHHEVMLGAQDLYHLPNGAYTGEVSTDMLLDLNVKVALVGHSERRHVIGEDDDLINAKARAALAAGLQVVLCVGETLEQRQAGRTKQVNVGQLMSGLREVAPEQMRQVTIAYEPVWAIGTGNVATPQDAAEVHRVLRATVADLYDEDVSQSIRIQYGGSVKAQSAAGLFTEPDIDGGLIGGASLQAEQFAGIVRSAAETAQ
ncbi:MAG: triose-phosphate isomerase [Planctomycetota bacterium]|jgi:triosephosphate isomerase